MLSMDELTTAWELVIRSGSIDLLRTTLGGVDRAFYRLTRQLKFDDFFNLVFADILCVGQFLNRARGRPRSSDEQGSLFILDLSGRQLPSAGLVVAVQR